MKKQDNLGYIFIELGHHLPYTIFSVTIGLILVGILSFMAVLLEKESMLPVASQDLFHVFFPAHVLFSTVTTTAMFWKYEKNLLKAIIVGIFGSLFICGVSDIIFPYFGGILLGMNMKLHICILEEPFLVIPFSIVGVLAGLMISKNFEKSTEYSHTMHVFVSSAGAILYLVGYGLQDWFHMIGGVFLVTVISVLIPCCTSDIVLPISCAKKEGTCNH